eukprot:Nk52_evm45s207 gene=Nk52_evmTU45s207
MNVDGGSAQGRGGGGRGGRGGRGRGRGGRGRGRGRGGGAEGRNQGGGDLRMTMQGNDVQMESDSPRGNRGGRYNPYGRNKRGGGGGNDNDVNMGSRGGGSGGNRGASRGNAESSTIIINNVYRQDMDEFLTGLASVIPVQIVKNYYKGNSLFVTCQSSDIANKIVELSGNDFKGKKVYIKKAGYANNDGAGAFGFNRFNNNNNNQGGGESNFNEEVLIAFLSKAYKSENKFLDFSSIYKNPVLREGNVRGDFNNRNFTNAILELINKNCPEVETITFENNRIRSLFPLKMLAQKAPNVINLSFEKNSISHFNELDHLKDMKHLREIILLVNPISHPRQNDPAVYQSEVRKRFPDLKMIDGTQLLPAIQFDIGADEQKLPTAQGSYFEMQDIQGLIVAFLQMFFSSYDQNRAGLMSAYSENALFSLSVSKSGEIEDSSKGSHRYNKIPSVKPYLGLSRNLQRVTDLNKRANFLISGASEIVNCISSLPLTCHIADSMIVETWIIQPEKLCAFIHGNFTEPGPQNNAVISRMFDRSLVLVPALPGSPAALNGWPATIVNDQLHITSVPNTTSSTSSSSSQTSLIKKLSMETGMTLDFSQQCLQNNSWDYDTAKADFLNLKSEGRIPPEAFA